MNAPIQPNEERRNILCGFDFSENARMSARVAAAIAKKLGDSVCLLHALGMPPSGIHPGIITDFLAYQNAALSQEAKRIRDLNVEVEEQVLFGYPDEVLAEVARGGSTRMIILSSTGKRSSGRILLGSVSERTAQSATVPTLVVRDPTPFEKWARGEKHLKVFVAFNFSSSSETALRWAKRLEDIGPCEFTIAYVDWPPDERMRIGSEIPSPLVGNSEAVQKVLDRDLQARVADIIGLGSFRTRAEANWGRPAVRLAQMAAEEAADLVVVGSHQYQGFERLWHTSVSRGLLHNAAMSVAVVPLCKHESRIGDPIPVIRRVLVAIDFSGISDEVIPKAYSLLPNGGTVHLLHVLGRNGIPQEDESPLDPKTAEERLHALVPVAANRRNVISEFEIVESTDAATAILQASERTNADAICLGSHGRSGLSRLLLGSVTQKVLAGTRRAVFIVRPSIR